MRKSDTTTSFFRNYLLLLTVYVFIGAIIMGMYTGDEQRKCPGSDDPSAGEYMAGSIFWLPLLIGRSIRSDGRKWEDIPCKKQ
jgi:hypothetical protein